MNWEEILNKRDFAWNINSNDVNLKANSREVAFRLHQVIFKINEHSFWKYIDFLIKKLRLEKDNKLVEVGCGNGSLLLGLNQIIPIASYGLDISKSLIEVCKRVFPKQKNNFKVGTFPDLKYDRCLINSVAQYLDEDLILKLIKETSSPIIVISDVKNTLFEDDFKLEQAQRQNITLEERNKKYANTPIKHYPQSFFRDLTYKVNIEPMPDFYPDSKFGSYVVTIIK